MRIVFLANQDILNVQTGSTAVTTSRGIRFWHVATCAVSSGRRITAFFSAPSLEYSDRTVPLRRVSSHNQGPVPWCDEVYNSTATAPPNFQFSSFPSTFSRRRNVREKSSFQHVSELATCSLFSRPDQSLLSRTPLTKVPPKPEKPLCRSMLSIDSFPSTSPRLPVVLIRLRFLVSLPARLANPTPHAVPFARCLFLPSHFCAAEGHAGPRRFHGGVHAQAQHG